MKKAMSNHSWKAERELSVTADDVPKPVTVPPLSQLSSEELTDIQTLCRQKREEIANAGLAWCTRTNFQHIEKLMVEELKARGDWED